MIWADPFLFCLYSIWKFLIQGYHDPTGASSSPQPQAISLDLIGMGCGSSGGLVLTPAHSLQMKAKANVASGQCLCSRVRGPPLNESFLLCLQVFSIAHSKATMELICFQLQTFVHYPRLISRVKNKHFCIDEMEQ